MFKVKTIVLFFLLHLCYNNLLAQCHDSLQIEIYSTKDEFFDYEYQSRVVTHFTSTGKKSSVASFQYISGIWVPSGKSLYFYDTSDSLIQLINYQPVDTGWINFTQFLYTFSATGKLIYFNSQKWDGFTWEDVEHKTNTYDSFDNLTNTWSEKKFSETWKNQNQVFYFYDSLNNDTLEIFQSGAGSSWNNMTRFHYGYDTSGNKIYQLKDIWNNNAWSPTEQIFYTYNGSFLSSALVQEMDSIWQDFNLHTYTYGPLGQQIRDTTYEWTPPDWIMREVKITDVDAYGYPSYHESFNCHCTTPVDCDCESMYGYEEFHYDSTGHFLGSYDDPIPGGEGSTHNTYDNNWILLQERGSSTTMGGIYSAHKNDYYYNEIHGYSSFCSGSNTVLSVDSCPGYTFLWNTGDSTSSIIADTAGTYTVEVTYPNGFQTYTEPFIVHVDSFPPQFVSTPDSVKNICSNRALNLNGPAFSSVQYQWYRNDTALGGLINSGIYLYGTALKPGSYYLVAFNSCGTDTSAKSIVNLLPAPDATITASGSTALCPGDSVMLSAPSGYSYIWNTGATTQQITSSTSGTKKVTVTNSFGCKENGSIYIISVSFPTIPQIVQDNNGLHCTTTAYFYQWLLNGDTIPGATSAHYAHTIPGNYSVICAFNVVCPSYSLTHYFDLCFASVTSTSFATCAGICDGTFSVISSGTPPFSYHWSTSDTTPTISSLCAGTYFVAITDSLSCTSSDTITLTNDSLSIQSIVINNPTCIGCNDGHVIIIPVNGIAPYNSFCTPVAGSLYGNQIFLLPAGDYYVCLTDGNSCMVCDSVSLVDPGTSVSFYSSDRKINVYPNPFNKSITISFNDITLRTFQLNILDLHGRILVSEKNISKNSTVDLSHLSVGTYFIKLTGESGSYFGKIVRQ